MKPPITPPQVSDLGGFAAILAILLLAALHAPAQVQPIATEQRNRLNVLCLGDALPSVVTARVQEMLSDEFNLYRLASPATTLSERVLGAKHWHGILWISPPMQGQVQTSGDEILRTVRAMRSRGLFVTWGAIAVGGDGPVAARLQQTLSPVLRAEEATVVDLQVVFDGNQEAVSAGGQPADQVIGQAAAVIAKAVRQSALLNSSVWAEFPPGESRDPARLLAATGTLDQPDILPVAEGKTTTIYRARAGEWQFNMHAFIAHHDGKFWVMWSSGRQDEDSASQFVHYATSENGDDWTTPAVLVADPDGEAGPLRWMANGIYVEEGRLYALATRNEGIRDGMIWAGARLIRFVWNGEEWREDQIMGQDGLVYFPPIKVAGRDFVVWRNSRAHFATALRGPGENLWTVTPIPGPFPPYRLSETSHYVGVGGVMHLIIRDQGATRCLYRSVSYDNGVTWTIPVKTNYPDGMVKNYAARLTNGWHYLISNPRKEGPRVRDPLVISFSADGWSFEQPHILRQHAPEQRYPGKHKDPYSFQYAHAIEHGGHLWVVYSTNKEDIEVTSYPLDQFELEH